MTGTAQPLVGRDTEFELLDRLLEEACDGDCRFVALSGEPGIGKSSAARPSSARRAERRRVPGARGPRRRAASAEAARSACSIDALDAHLAVARAAAATRASPAERRSASWRPSSPRCARCCRIGAAGRPAGRALPRAPGRARAARAAGGREPVVLALDDVQWADEASARGAARTSCGARRGRRCCFALAFRASEQAPASLAGRSSRALELPAARPAHRGGGRSGWLGAEIGRRGPVVRLHRGSGGNPFYLTGAGPRVDRRRHRRTTATRNGGVPPAVAGAIAAELRALPAPRASRARAASVAGDPFDARPRGGGRRRRLRRTRSTALERAHLARHARAARRTSRAGSASATRSCGSRDRTSPRARRGRGCAAHARAAARSSRAVGASGDGRARTHVEQQRAPRRRGGDRGAARGGRGGRTARAGQRRPLVRGGAADPAAGRPARRARRAADAARRGEGGDRAPGGGARRDARDARAARESSRRCRGCGSSRACAALEHLLGRHDAARDRLASALDDLSDSPEGAALMGDLAMTAFFAMEFDRMRDWAAAALEIVRAASAISRRRPPRPRCSASPSRAPARSRPRPRTPTRRRRCSTPCPTTSQRSGSTPSAGLSGAEFYLERFEDSERHAPARAGAGPRDRAGRLLADDDRRRSATSCSSPGGPTRPPRSSTTPTDCGTGRPTTRPSPRLVAARTARTQR